MDNKLINQFKLKKQRAKYKNKSGQKKHVFLHLSYHNVDLFYNLKYCGMWPTLNIVVGPNLAYHWSKVISICNSKKNTNTYVK